MLRNAIELVAQQEGLELFVYDDKNGKAIIPGTTVKGNPTFGFGRNCGNPNLIDRDICLMDLVYEIWKIYREQPWFYQLSPWRQAALVSMRYNMGAGAFAHFTPFFSYLHVMDWKGAVNDLKSNPHLFTPEHEGRYEDICFMILNDAPPHALNAVTAEETSFSETFQTFIEQLMAINYAN